MKNKKQIVLIGNYGAGNLGDELLGIGAYNLLSQAFPESTISVLHANATPTDPDFKATHFLPLLPTGLRSFLRSLSGWKLFKTTHALKEADFVIFGGGGLFNTEVPRSLLVWGAHTLYTRYFSDAKLILIGQSFARAQGWKKKILRWLIRDAELITVRDQLSYKNIRELFPTDEAVLVKKNTDLIFMQSGSQTLANTAAQEIIISLRSYRALDQHVVLPFLQTIIRSLLETTKYQLRFIAMDPEDLTFAETVLAGKEASERIKLTRPETVAELHQLLTQAKGMIAMRLHAYLSSFLAELPALVLSYSSKVEGIARDLESEPCLINLQAVAEISQLELEQNIQQFLERVRNGNQEYRQELLNKKSEHQARIQDVIRYLQAFE